MSLGDLDDARLDEAITEHGMDLWHRMGGLVPSVFDRKYWQGRILDWAMQDPEFKLDLFRFVDVLPMLQTRTQVTQHVREYLLKEGRSLPTPVGFALGTAWGKLTAGLASRSLRRQISDMARRFIAAASPEEALPILRELHRQGLAFTADLLGEATVSDSEASAYQGRYLDLIEGLSGAVSRWPADAIIDRDHLGVHPRANISLKVSALSAHLDPVDAAGCVDRLRKRILPLLLRAKERNVSVNVDLEQWERHGTTYGLFEEITTCSELNHWPHLGIVVQAYLKSADQDLERLLSLARARGVPFTVRLVKGAYWDYEVVHARQHGYPCPVFMDKATTDANYERLTVKLLSHVDTLLPAFASHNLRSLTHAIVLAQQMGIPTGAYELQTLYGMAEPEVHAIRSLGHRVRVYCPIGELLPGIAYLVRRLLENTSNTGFLRSTYHERTDIQSLLARPRPPKGKAEQPRMKRGDVQSPFENCPHADFTDGSVRAAFAQAVEAQATRLPLEVPVVAAGETRFGGPCFAQVCPSDAAQLATRVTLGSEADVDTALDSAMRHWSRWRERSPGDRALLVERLADRLEADRFELAALQTFEAGKPWREADADVAEAVDFCRYYARRALVELTPHRQGDMWGEENVVLYEGRGPTAVISPWNFPLAILCGMSVAALVAGNPVLMKPARQSSGVAYGLYERLIDVGFPAEVVHFLPGSGEEIGRHLVAHPLVAQIAFTGSKAVGLWIVETAARTRAGQPQVKRVVCEMGGKNAIVVDDDADLDEAVVGVVRSAFGYAGQKCSACSRVLVIGSIYEPFVSRLVEACRSLVMAPAHLTCCELGPVIDSAAHDRLRKAIDAPGKGATPLYVGEAPSGGFYVPPSVFAVGDPDHRLMQEELFGPVVAVMQVKDFEEAMEVAVATEFALTGGVYSRSPNHLQEAKRRFRVGNLYLNRDCTGAVVDRQPFGGFGMSGIGTKAGGPGYLLHFAQPRCICENTVRRGFSPDVGL